MHQFRIYMKTLCLLSYWYILKLLCCSHIAYVLYVYGIFTNCMHYLECGVAVT